MGELDAEPFFIIGCRPISAHLDIGLCAVCQHSSVRIRQRNAAGFVVRLRRHHIIRRPCCNLFGYMASDRLRHKIQGVRVCIDRDDRKHRKLFGCHCLRFCRCRICDSRGSCFRLRRGIAPARTAHQKTSCQQRQRYIFSNFHMHTLRMDKIDWIAVIIPQSRRFGKPQSDKKRPAPYENEAGYLWDMSKCRGLRAFSDFLHRGGLPPSGRDIVRSACCG